jgi:predicted metal-dependent phosphoesterase TrpH
MAPGFDGQSHSTRSDGSLEPAEVVASAAAAGVGVLALTDHDTVEGVDEALGAAPRAGVAVVPGAELTAVDGVHDELHVVAYGIVEATLRRFAAAGMDGVEAFYPTHDRTQTHLLDDLAGELGLLATAASDFHGPEHEHFSRFLAYDTFGRQPRLGDLAVGGWP